jgi:hypothetical protein
MKCEWTEDDVVLEQELLIVLGTTNVLEELGVVLLDNSVKGAGTFTLDRFFFVTKLDQRDLVERKLFLLDVCQQSLFKSL